MNIDETQQVKLLNHIQECFNSSERMTKERRNQLFDVYEAVANFKEPRQNNWSSSFKINKAFQIVNEVVPDLTAKNPRWIVSAKNFQKFDFPETPIDPMMPPEMGEQARQKQAQEHISKSSEYASVVQDYLTYIFDEYNLMEPIEDYAKNMITDGKSYAEVCYKYQKAQITKMKDSTQPDGSVVKVPTIEEEVVGEYPTIEVIDWTEAYYDPRIKYLSDRPYFIRMRHKVRLADLLRKKKEYMNLDRIKELAMVTEDSSSDAQAYARRIEMISGIADITEKVNENELRVTTFYGFFNLTDDPVNEKLYKVTTANNLVVLKIEEILQMPIEEVKCFPDTKTAYATGFVEPIIALQNELNFKKNSASEYINKGLTRQVIWSPNSGIDPRTINDPVIISTKDGHIAQANFIELAHRELNPSYFQEGNDLERQIQGLTFRIDTTQPTGQQALTDTATGARIKFYESSKVRAAVRKRFEQALERIAYKLLQSTFENMDDNIVFKKMGTEEYWHINKEVLKNAIARYTIKVETNSSSFTDAESRRDDAIAWFNILLKAKQMGSNVDLDKTLEDIGMTFEKKDPTQFINPPQVAQVAAQMSPQAAMAQGAGLPENQRMGGSTADMVRQVANGNLQ
jgi:hypothetical protein